MDIQAQIDAVDRALATGERDGAPTYVQTIAQTYRAPLDDVWDALTSVERIPRWFLPISGDLRLGGRYDIEGNASGTVESCDAPRSFGVTWEYGGGITWLTVRLSEVDAEQTRVEL
ncbi:MAG TPA: SRPBCC domain-containing protein, partial [Agromyces sp.]|nr:SRPBCC domain-containing protein [Agromyces sp.]